MDDFEALRTSVAGCSTDSPDALRAFADKHALRFPLLSDADGAIARAYGLLGEHPDVATRSTVLVGGDGLVLRVYPRVRARGHAEAVLEEIRRTTR